MNKRPSSHTSRCLLVFVVKTGGLRMTHGDTPFKRTSKIFSCLQAWLPGSGGFKLDLELALKQTRIYDVSLDLASIWASKAKTPRLPFVPDDGDDFFAPKTTSQKKSPGWARH